jgi:Family of unknown function (DUF6404)
MTHSEKLQKLLEHAPKLGISPYTAAPPLYRLLWRLGIEIPPPLFAAFLPNAFLMGGFFTCSWGLFMCLFIWAGDGKVSAFFALQASLFAGLMFGITMALYLRYKARQLNLPPWSEYSGRPSRL